MTAPSHFFDGQNDFRPRLLTPPAPSEATWPGTAGRGPVDLPRMWERRPVARKKPMRKDDQ